MWPQVGMREMPEIIRQIDFADMTGTSRQNVYKGIKKGMIKVNAERNVIFDDPTTQIWYKDKLQKNGIQLAQQIKAVEQPTQKPQKSFKPKKNIAVIENNQVPDSDKSLVEVKLEQEIRKLKADVRLKKLKYSVERGDLIEKKKLAHVLFRYLDALNLAMLDFPEMIIDELIDKIKSGMDRGELIKLMRDHLGETIKRTKIQVKDRIE